jgi:uncharacterized protein (TIGR02271 family)
VERDILHPVKTIFEDDNKVEKEGSIDMTTAQQLVVGVFRERAQAEQAIHALLQAGFGHHQIRFAERGGGILEKIKNLFTGQDIAAGGINDDLVKMGVSPENARYYQSEFEAGHSIVTILPDGRVQEATTILARHGGYGINPAIGQPTGYSRATGAQQPTTEGEQQMKLREEELRARKQTVETGEARVHKDVVVEQKSIDVPVTHEEVYVERRPGSGLPSDQPIGEGETYRIPVYEEQVTVEKQPVEREEVSFGKRPVQETQRVTDTTQREEAHIEQTGDVNVRDKGAERGRGVKRDRGVERGRDRENI